MTRGFASMRDLAKHLFGDIISEEDFNSVYTRDGVFIEEIPFAAQTHVYRAKTLFNKKEDEQFHVTLDLGKQHTIKEADDITQDELNSVIKPAFANAYLHKVGIAPTEKAIRAVGQMFAITSKNILVHTKNKGFDKEEIIVKERPDQYYSNIRRTVKSEQTDKKCSTIRENIIDAWKLIDDFFPRELPMDKPKIFTPEIKYLSLLMIDKYAKVPEKRPSTLVKKPIPCKNPNPFTNPWRLMLTKEKIDQVITTFCDKFDFKKNYKATTAQIEQIVQAMTLGIIPRLLYHIMKYVHSIFVLDLEDLSNYIRIRALWYMCQAKYPPSDDFSILSPVLAMFKVCTVITFATESPKYHISNQKDMEATVFTFIDKMLNPFKVFDSMIDVHKTAHSPKPIRIPTGRSLNDIIDLVENYPMMPDDQMIAKTMLNSNAQQDLLKLLSNEPWGDIFAESIEEEDQADEVSALPIQKLIQQDLKELNWKNPRPVQEWMKVDPKLLNLKSFIPLSESSSNFKKTSPLSKKKNRRRSQTIKTQSSLPATLSLKPLSGASSKTIVGEV